MCSLLKMLKFRFSLCSNVPSFSTHFTFLKTHLSSSAGQLCCHIIRKELVASDWPLISHVWTGRILTSWPFKLVRTSKKLLKSLKSNRSGLCPGFWKHLFPFPKVKPRAGRVIYLKVAVNIWSAVLTAVCLNYPPLDFCSLLSGN